MRSLLFCIFLLSCTAVSSTPDAGTDAFVDGPFGGWRDTLGDRSLYQGGGFVGARSPDGEGYCCPYRYPTCNCFDPGSGFAERETECNSWGSVCDAEPERFRIVVDEHRCVHYEQVSVDFELISCFDR